MLGTGAWKHRPLPEVLHKRESNQSLTHSKGEPSKGSGSGFRLRLLLLLLVIGSPRGQNRDQASLLLLSFSALPNPPREPHLTPHLKASTTSLTSPSPVPRPSTTTRNQKSEIPHHRSRQLP